MAKHSVDHKAFGNTASKYVEEDKADVISDLRSGDIVKRLPPLVTSRSSREKLERLQDLHTGVLGELVNPAFNKEICSFKT